MLFFTTILTSLALAHRPVFDGADRRPAFDNDIDVFNYGYGRYPYAENSCQQLAQRRYTERVLDVQRAYQAGQQRQVNTGDTASGTAAWQALNGQRMNDELIRLQAE